MTKLELMKKFIALGFGDMPLLNGGVEVNNYRTGKHAYQKRLMLDGTYRAVYTEQDGPSRPWLVGGDEEAYQTYKTIGMVYSKSITPKIAAATIEIRNEMRLYPERFEICRDIKKPGVIVIGYVYRRKGGEIFDISHSGELCNPDPLFTYGEFKPYTN